MGPGFRRDSDGRLRGSYMPGELLLVGSVPLDTVEQVFRAVGEPSCPTARSAIGGIGSTGSLIASSTGIRKSRPCGGPLPTKTASSAGDRKVFTTSFGFA